MNEKIFEIVCENCTGIYQNEKEAKKVVEELFNSEYIEIIAPYEKKRSGLFFPDPYDISYQFQYFPGRVHIKLKELIYSLPDIIISSITFTN